MKRAPIALTLLIACITGIHLFGQSEPYVVLVSYDGFRHDYVEKFGAPNFEKLIEAGTSAEMMIPSFPSKTFPNHYTVVTGMYPGNHGLVGNTFYDLDRDTVYTMRKRELVEDAYYYGGLPLWQLVQRAGMKSASYFWVGSEAPVAGSFPDYYEIYEHERPNEQRVAAVLDWLRLPKAERPRLITLYFSLVDSQGHDTGPNAPETGEAVKEADRLLGLLMDGLGEIDLPVNLIVTSDHGMYEIQRKEETFIFLDDYLPEEDPGYRLVNTGTHAHLYFSDRMQMDKLYPMLKAKEEAFSVYRKSETPARWHYRDHRRIGDLLIAAEPGHLLTTRRAMEERPVSRNVWGVHGYDPYTTPEMGGIFYAMGPDIKQGVKLPPFENVHVYPLVAKILGLEAPEEVDGELQVLENCIKE